VYICSADLFQTSFVETLILSEQKSFTSINKTLVWVLKMEILRKSWG